MEKTMKKLLVALLTLAALAVPAAAHASTCAGVAVSPGGFTQALVDGYPSGTTFCLASGTFTQSAPVTPKSNDQVVGTGKATTVLTGSDSTPQALVGHIGTQVGVVVKNLTLTHFTGTALQTGSDWTVNTVALTYSRSGIEVNDGSVLKNSAVNHNTVYGINGDGDGNKLLNNNVGNNNTSHHDTGDAGGMKFDHGASNILIQGNSFHDNYGPGIWCDGCGANITVDANTTTHNTGPGIILEIDASGTVTGNTLTDDLVGQFGQSCWWGGAITIQTTPNVEVAGNTVVETAGQNGVCAVDADRIDKVGPVTNLNVHDNNVTQSGTSGLVGAFAAAFQPPANNRFVHNAYDVPNPTTGAYWAWNTYPLTWAQWQAVGQDTTGSVSRPGRQAFTNHESGLCDGHRREIGWSE